METPVNQRAHGLKRLADNPAGRDFVVGDLHGQYDLLMGELDRAGFDRDADRLICVGDLVDRGPRSVECLSLLREPWFFAVLGNHEDMMLDALNEAPDVSVALHWMNKCGGDWIREADLDRVADLVRDHARTMPLAIEVPVGDRLVGVIHAAVSSAQWGLFHQESDIWNRRIARDRHLEGGPVPQEAMVQGVDAVVVGHNITETPFVRGNTLSLDTGAAMGLPPTIWSLEAVLDAVDRHADTRQSLTFFSSLSRRVVGHSLNTLML